MISLKGKCIFVTGASRGIGRQAAMMLAAAGADLALAARDQEALISLKEHIEATYGSQILTLVYDIQDEQATKEAFRQIKKQFGHLDGLINNAGILESRLLGMIDQASMQHTLSINLAASIIHLQYAARLMKSQRSGSIVNLSSIMGTQGSEGQVLYSASKAGIIGATRSAAKELAPYGIRVNAIAPGFIRTDLATVLPEEKYNERLDSIKMGRIGEPEEVAGTVLFLCSELSTYVTGQIIGVDGGMVI